MSIKTKRNKIKLATAHTTVSAKVSGLIHKSRAKWKMLRGIYSAIIIFFFFSSTTSCEF
jgi:hypothetical protein